MKWHSALETAQSWNVPGSNKYPNLDDGRFELVDLWRNALVQQVLTPAPDQNSVTWKRAQLRGGQHRHVGVKDETLQRAIDADVKWLAAHPSKKSVAMSSERKEERRIFKDAMRQRIKQVAVARDIPDDEIQPVLSLKHRHVAEFATNHGVNFAWLYEGTGEMFGAARPPG